MTSIVKRNVLSLEAFRRINDQPREKLIETILAVGSFNLLRPDNAYLVTYETICKIIGITSHQISKYDNSDVIEYLEMVLPPPKDQTYDNYVIGGGGIINAIRNLEIGTDVDIFLHHEDLTQIESCYMKVMDHLQAEFENTKRQNSTAHANLARSKYVTDIKMSLARDDWEDLTPFKFQIIQRAYTSPSAAVVSFDLAPCKCFFDGAEIYFTIDAALSLIHCINVIDWRRESASFFTRLEKYDAKGFELVFPGIDVSKITRGVSLKLADGKSTIYRRKMSKNDPPTYHLTNQSYDKAEHINRQEYNDDTEEVAKHRQNLYRAGSQFKECVSLFLKERDSIHNILNVGECEVTTADYMIVSCVGYKDCCPLIALDEYKYLRADWHKIKAMHDNFSGLSNTDILNLSQLMIKYKRDVKEYNAEIQLILDDIYKEYDKLSFVTTRAGSKFSGSFLPIIRSGPKEFWGENYQGYRDKPIYDSIIQLLLIRKLKWQENIALGKVPIDVMKMIWLKMFDSYLNLY